MPRDDCTLGIQVATSFDTKVLPAPVRLPAVCLVFDAPAPVVVARAVRVAATSAAARMVSFLVKFSSPCKVWSGLRRACLHDERPWAAERRRCGDKVVTASVG